ncbi:xylulokinase [Dictyobacter arantiisoli]|uniref:Sugar kinase n=1 Tax=Dictyobacter arantiisoli TaxID=2014874 RepID=A0A5A5T8G9_9CHLR|nr:FGGY family carbohydrate kinase [Dictyobacter arantiisoli]GCF07456.1 sugar kinase [Dictyobacter arantiisoli]
MKIQGSGGAMLGIDIGTSSVKALLLDLQGHTLAVSKAAYPVASPRPGWSESDPEDWWRGTVTAVHAVQAQVPQTQIVALGLSGQMHGVVLVTANEQVVRPALLWSDTRATAELDLYRQLPAATLQRLANPLVPGMAGPLLRWLALHETASYQQARWALQPKDWIRLRLTGKIITEASDASGTLLYDLPADNWAHDVIEALELRRELFPTLMASSASAGTLTTRAARELDLPVGLPVAAGAADTAAAALGTGLLTPGTMQLTIGTGAQLIKICEQPQSDPNLLTHLYRAADGSHWYAMAAVQNAGLALDWVCRVLHASWDELYASAEQIVPDLEHGFFLPYVTRERPHHANPHSQAAWLHLRIDQQRVHLLHAALEGVAFGIREALTALPGSDQTIPLRLAGGGGQHPAWQKMLATILQRELILLEAPDASARGAALLGGLANGTWPDIASLNTLAPRPVSRILPDTQLRELYTRRYARFLASGD